MANSKAEAEEGQAEPKTCVALESKKVIKEWKRHSKNDKLPKGAPLANLGQSDHQNE